MFKNNNLLFITCIFNIFENQGEKKNLHVEKM